MTGFKRILFRMIPFILILCFVAYGIEILNALSPNHINQLTYLQEKIVYDSNNVEVYRYYEYDFATYLRNITIQPFVTVLNQFISFQTFRDLKTVVEDIWADGYNALDVSKSIVNILVGVGNAIITLVNVVLVPLRFIAAILVVGLSITGINTDITQNTNPVNQGLWYMINNPIIPTIPYWN